MKEFSEKEEKEEMAYTPLEIGKLTSIVTPKEPSNEVEQRGTGAATKGTKSRGPMG